VAFYLGIDSGGSKTTCAVGDEQSLLATATAGPSNVVRVGEARARKSLHQAVRQACAAAGITPPQVAHTCIGAAGAVRPEILSIVRMTLAEVVPAAIDVVGDMEIALNAAFDDGPGVIVIAGTGSIAYGRDRGGNIARAGGWGFAVSDEGSAHWIGRTAITAVLRERDSVGTEAESSRELPFLLTALLKAWGVVSFDDFLRVANSAPPPDFAALFPALVAAVQENDEVARRILSQAGRELASLAAIVIQRLQSKAGSLNTPVRLAIAGGVFRHAPVVREVFYNELRQLHLPVELNPQIVEPVEGALRLARRAANRTQGHASE
jgi:glucosamine kinase